VSYYRKFEGLKLDLEEYFRYYKKPKKDSGYARISMTGKIMEGGCLGNKGGGAIIPRGVEFEGKGYLARIICIDCAMVALKSIDNFLYEFIAARYGLMESIQELTVRFSCSSRSCDRYQDKALKFLSASII